MKNFYDVLMTVAVVGALALIPYVIITSIVIEIQGCIKDKKRIEDCKKCWEANNEIIVRSCISGYHYHATKYHKLNAKYFTWDEFKKMAKHKGNAIQKEANGPWYHLEAILVED